MKNRNTVLLIGNGFLYSLIDFIRSKEIAELHGSNDIDKKLEEIARLWDKFDDIRQKIKTKLGKKVSIEKGIEYIYNFIDIVEKIYNHVYTNRSRDYFNYKSCEDLSFKNIRKCIEKFFFKKVTKIVEKFWSDEKILYPVIIKLISKQSDWDQGKHFLSHIKNIYTTNYDMVAYAIFKSIGSTSNKLYDESNFDFFDDMFIDKHIDSRKCSDYYLCFNINNNDSTPRLLHLHGSYRLFKIKYTGNKEGEEIKVKEGKYIEFYKCFEKKYLSNFDNKDHYNYILPILILNAPGDKKKSIEEYRCLKTYFNLFERDLENENIVNLVIWGQSLKDDPHIFKTIGEKFIYNDKKLNKRKKIILIDTDTEGHAILKVMGMLRDLKNSHEEGREEEVNKSINKMDRKIKYFLPEKYLNGKDINSKELIDLIDNIVQNTEIKVIDPKNYQNLNSLFEEILKEL